MVGVTGSATPQRFGPFEVIAPIAQGGQGAVLRALHRPSGRAVALKLLLRADPKSVRRFRQEAQVLARLEHPSIVRVIDHGEEGGVPYLAMALVEGESLKAIVGRAGAPPLASSLRVVEAVARALAHCHERGVVHRDLKPDNVLIERGTGRPVLVDFGLLQRDAEVFGELSIDQRSKLSVTGEVKGTPSFMAPEQASPKRFGEAGPATDVYALGGLLFFLLAGRPPHAAASLPQLIYQILDGATPDPRADAPWVPGPVADLCRRALARSPADRVPGAAAFADEVAGLQRLATAADASRSRTAVVAPPSGAVVGPYPGVAPAAPTATSPALAPTATSPAAPTATSAGGRPPFPGPAAGPALRPGAHVGPYELIDILGKGGMGMVFRARHRTLGVVRAVKVLSASNDAKRRARFEREVTGLARVRHDNVVAIHEAGVEGATPWFAMDLVEGEPLDALMERGRLPVERALALAIGVARGVEALHALGIIHRDLKPQNVIVRGDHRPLVIDLGLAVDPERDERLTRMGTVLGTIRYMAPEQLSGRHSERSDVYALGLITLELLTGEPAFPEEASSVSEISARILTEDRPLPGDLDPSLGKAIDDVVGAACARDPGRRQPGAGALAEALERAARDPGPTRAVRTRARRRGLFAGAAGLALVTTGVVALAPAPAAATAPGRPGARPVDEAAAVEAARRDLEGVLTPGLADDERLRRANDWLERFSGLPALARDEARAALVAAAARRRAPLRSFSQVTPGDPAVEARARWVDDRRVVTWGRHEVVRLLDVPPEADGGAPERSPAPRVARRWSLPFRVEAVAVAPGARLLVVGANGSVWALDLDGAAGPREVASLGHPSTAIGVDMSGGRVVVGAPDGRVRVLEPEAGSGDGLRVARELEGHGRALRVVAFSPDGQQLVTGSGAPVGPARPPDDVVILWDATSWTERWRGRLDATPEVAAWSPDGGTVALGTSGYRLHLLDARAPGEPRPLQGEGTAEVALGFDAPPPAHGGPVRGAVFARDGARLFSVSGEREVPGAENGLRAWRVAGMAEDRERAVTRRATPLSIDVSPDGARLVIGYRDGTVEVWAAE